MINLNFILDLNMKFLLVSIVIFCLFNSAFSIICYKCAGIKNCKFPTLVNCGDDYHSCQTDKIFVKEKLSKIAKHCVYECIKDEWSTSLLGVVTEFTCCKGNLCNGSENLSKNKLLFCAVVFHAVSKLFL